MDIQTALQAFEQGHMTKYEAASLMVHLIQFMPDVAPRYAPQINALIQAKYIQQRNGIYFARRPGGRPRNKKPAIQTTLRIDPETLAAIDTHPLARFMSRNDLILFLLQGALKIQH